MARIFGTVLILAGCAGFCTNGQRGKKPDSGWRGNGYACLCAGDMHWNRNMCGCTIFCLFMKRQMHPCRHFWMRSVYVCATIRIQADRKSGRIVCRSTKENCRSGRRAGKSLRLPREHFMAKAVQRICDAMKSAENGWKISGRVTVGIFKKTAGVSACWNADRRGYDHSSGVKA